MGSSSSCKPFEEFSSALEHIIHHQTNGTVLHIDSECKQLLQSFIITADNLGLPLAVEKMEGPNTVLSFLGIELDTEKQVARLSV